MVVQRRESRRRSILVLAVVTALALITLDTRGSPFLDRLRDTGRDALAPLQDGVNAVVDPVSEWTDGIFASGSLRAENRQLRTQLGEAKRRLFALKAQRTQLSELEELLDLPNIEDASGVPARVIGGAPGNFERTVQIDRGTDAGLRIGLPVVSGSGLVGKLTEVSETRATVTLLDAAGIGVGVRLEKSRVQGILEGRAGDKLLNLGFLQEPRAKIDVGELVFTAPTEDSAFPPDIAVARVTSVDRRPGVLDPDVRVRPVVDLDRLTYVKVLRYPS